MNSETPTTPAALPPLPKAAFNNIAAGFVSPEGCDAFTADQMRSYAEQAVREALAQQARSTAEDYASTVPEPSQSAVELAQECKRDDAARLDWLELNQVEIEWRQATQTYDLISRSPLCSTAMVVGRGKSLREAVDAGMAGLASLAQPAPAGEVDERAAPRVDPDRLVNRAEDLHEKAFMPWQDAVRLALSEQGIGPKPPCCRRCRFNGYEPGEECICEGDALQRAADALVRAAEKCAAAQAAVIECDCETATSPDGSRFTRCGSDQMRRAVEQGHAFVKAPAQAAVVAMVRRDEEHRAAAPQPTTEPGAR